MRKIGLLLVFCLIIIWVLSGSLRAFEEKSKEDTWSVTPTVEIKEEPVPQKQQVNTQPPKKILIEKNSGNPSVTLCCGGKEFTIYNIIPCSSPQELQSREISKSLYISLEDDGTESFFKHIGAFYNWSTRGDVLFISSSGRDIYFGENFSRVKFRSEEMVNNRGYIRKEGKTYLPLYETIKYLGIACNAFTPDTHTICRLIPIIDDIYVKEDDGTRKLFIHTSMPVKYAIEEEDSRHVTLLFPETEWGIINFNRSVSDFSINQKQQDHNVRLVVNFPSNWDGRLHTRMMSGDISIELIPSFPLISGYRSETIEKILYNSAEGCFSLKLSASGPIHYFWDLDEENKMLTIDFPLVTGACSLKLPPVDKNYVSSFSLNSFNSGYGATRMYVYLKDDIGFEFSTTRDDPYSLTIRFRKGPTLLGKEGKGYTSQPEACGTIVIDPGHGGCDPGACNASQNLQEKDLTLDISLRLTRFLRNMGWKVVLTRTTDRDVSWANSPDRVELQARTDVANINNADAFISIHCNASTSPSLNGSSIHWFKDIDFPLAQSFKELLGKAIGLVDRGLHRDGFYVLRHAKMPAVLIETAFISNFNDALKLADSRFRERLANTIATGLNFYMSGRFANKRIKLTSNSKDNSSGATEESGAHFLK